MYLVYRISILQADRDRLHSTVWGDVYEITYRRTLA